MMQQGNQHYLLRWLNSMPW